MTNVSTPNVESLKDLINYQDGSVVSREINSQERGNPLHSSPLRRIKD